MQSAMEVEINMKLKGDKGNASQGKGDSVLFTSMSKTQKGKKALINHLSQLPLQRNTHNKGHM